METPIIVAIISAIALIVSAFINVKKQSKIHKLYIEKEELQETMSKQHSVIKDRNFKISTLNRILNFRAFNQIKTSVERIFENTKADQFLILIAVNGTTDFRLISVIFEQHKNVKFKVNALIRYRDIEIDDSYKKLLKDVEHHGSIDLEVTSMNPQLLKDFYTIENITHSKLRFLHRHQLEDGNDILLYSSLATHQHEPWTHLENAIIKSEYEGSIIHTIREFI